VTCISVTCFALWKVASHCVITACVVTTGIDGQHEHEVGSPSFFNAAEVHVTFCALKVVFVLCIRASRCEFLSFSLCSVSDNGCRLGGCESPSLTLSPIVFLINPLRRPNLY
jgi:hypothetical protein